MGTHQDTGNGDPFPSLGWVDLSLFEFGIDEVNPDRNQLPFLVGIQDHQQSAQGPDNTQEQWNGNAALLNGPEFFSTTTDTEPFSNSNFEPLSDLDVGHLLDLDIRYLPDLDFRPFPDWNFDMDITDNSTPTSSAPTWTPQELPTSPGTNLLVAASDISCSSPSQLSTLVPSQLPIAPRPIAPAPPHLTKLPYGQVDQETSRDQRGSAVTTVSHAPEQSPALPVTRTSRRPRGGRSMPAREYRKIKKPVKCQLCGKGHSYHALLRRHIEAHHKNEAHLFGVSTKRTPCPKPGCSQSFASTRPDHLSRHIKRKHTGP